MLMEVGLQRYDGGEGEEPVFVDLAERGAVKSREQCMGSLPAGSSEASLNPVCPPPPSPSPHVRCPSALPVPSPLWARGGCG